MKKPVSVKKSVRANNVGFLRLLFASLVIIGHAPEMMDGNRSRDLITSVFGTASLGELSVAAFFLLSGFLISKSMVQTNALLPYIERRVLRIYPAFIVASLLCVFVLAPLVGASAPPLGWTLPRILILGTPTTLPGAFPGLPYYTGLNGSMWTIAYEFRCYLLVAVLWLFGFLSRRAWVLGFTAVVLVACILSSVLGSSDGPAEQHWIRILIGRTDASLTLTGAFLFGTSLYLFWDVVEARLTATVALVGTMGAAALMFEPHVSQVAMITLGAAPLFWLAFKARLGPLQAVNDRWDISYGVYLYGWPIENTIRWLVPNLSPWTLAVISLPLAFAFGAASWWGIERWTKDIRRSRSKSSFKA
jgi:peptidoglycan/LPS O-acetylase OafA/YrhL